MNKIVLTIKSDDGKLSFEHEISLPEAGSIISNIGNNTNTEIIKDLKIVNKPQSSINDTKELLNNLEKYQPKSNVEKLVVFADYLNFKKLEQPFSEEELKKVFELSNLKMPENFKRDLGIAVDRGVIFKLKDSDLFITTERTKKELENMITKQNIDESTIFKKKRLRGKTERAEFNTSIKSVPITGSIKGINVKYRELKSGSDRILWILLYLKSHNFELASIKDIEYISEKLGKVVQSKYFAMYNKTNVEEGRVAKVESKFRVTEEGENVIKL